MTTPQPVLGRLARDDDVLWSIRIEPAPRLDPVLVLVGAAPAGRLTAVAWARALLKGLHPDRPAACLVVGARPRLLSPLGPHPRCLPTEALLEAAREGQDLDNALELAWAELGRCASGPDQAAPEVGAQLVVIGGPWDADGEASLLELEALGVGLHRIDREGDMVPPPDGASLAQLLERLGAAPPEVCGRLEVALSEPPGRWWVWTGVELIPGSERPLASLDLPLRAWTVALTAPQDPEGTVRIDLADGTPLVTALEPAQAGEVPPELVAALEGL